MSEPAKGVLHPCIVRLDDGRYFKAMGQLYMTRAMKVNGVDHAPVERCRLEFNLIDLPADVAAGMSEYHAVNEHEPLYGFSRIVADVEPERVTFIQGAKEA